MSTHFPQSFLRNISQKNWEGFQERKHKNFLVAERRQSSVQTWRKGNGAHVAFILRLNVDNA